MANFYIFIATLAMVHCGSLATNSQCSSDSRCFSLSARGTKNDSDQWTDLFSARSEHSSALQSITMDVMHNITECDGRMVIHIQGSIGKAGESEVGSNVTISNNGTTVEEENTDEADKGMVFHSRVGSNVIISNNGKTIDKKNTDIAENGTAFTSRPLEHDALFEVKLDRKGSKIDGGSFAIGVLTVRPEDYEFRDFAYESPNAWMYYDNRILSNDTEKRTDYGVNIDDFPAGTRFGVMRKSSSDDIHFYVNGEDQGSALSGISGPIYGVTELYDNAEKITILKP